MKILLTLIVAVGFLTACQKKQYYSSSPEIDVAKKADEAYFKGDWTALRGMYADTTKIYTNNWGETAQTPDEFIESLKTGLPNYTSYKQGPDAAYEMVVTDKGISYVYSWQQWVGMHKSGKEIHSVIHIALRVVNGKIAWQGLVYDSLPLYMADQKADSMVMK